MRSSLALCVVLFTASAAAHPLSFGLLELRDEPLGRVHVTWRFSGTEQTVEPGLPTRCAMVSPIETEAIADGVARRFTVNCGPEGIAGAEVSVRGLNNTSAQVIVRHVSSHGSAETVLDGAQPTWIVPVAASPASVFARYVALGVEHIATGWDHLAFVLGIALLVRNRRALLLAVTAFTVGHSATLALASLGFAHAPARAVEAAIAWSIVVVAREALLRGRDTPTLARRDPWAMSALFGLLHGFGFAGALAQVGLPRGAIVPALLAFNIGVELGQLAFIGLGLAIATVALRARVPEGPARVALAYTIGVAGACWCGLRLMAFG